jgi:hypothetical protein
LYRKTRGGERGPIGNGHGHGRFRDDFSDDLNWAIGSLRKRTRMREWAMT